MWVYLNSSRWWVINIWHWIKLNKEVSGWQSGCCLYLCLAARAHRKQTWPPEEGLHGRVPPCQSKSGWTEAFCSNAMSWNPFSTEMSRYSSTVITYPPKHTENTARGRTSHLIERRLDKQGRGRRFESQTEKMIQTWRLRWNSAGGRVSRGGWMEEQIIQLLQEHTRHKSDFF